jgi:hypothetical protein
MGRTGTITNYFFKWPYGYFFTMKRAVAFAWGLKEYWTIMALCGGQQYQSSLASTLSASIEVEIAHAR